MAHSIRVHETGGAEMLRWDPVEVGAPAPGQALIRQHAVGLNYIDVYHRTGFYPQDLPFTPGVEGAGIVEAVSDGVRHVAVGDRIAYAGPIGGYAEARTIAADRLVKLPDSIDFETAAAAMLQGLTAHMLVRSIFPVKTGDTILVHAAAGGVGLFLCQWAAALGATVIGTVSTPEKAELARAHGCHHPILYTERDFVAEVRRITSGEKLPVVFDSVGADTFLRSLDCLRRRGLMVSFGQASGPIAPLVPTLLAQKGSLFLTRPTLSDYVTERAELEAAAAELFEMIGSGRLKVRIGQRFALRDAAEAHRALEARATTGSTVLTV